MKPKSWYQSANVAIEGILYAAKTQRHLRWHFITAALVVLLALYLGLDKMEFIALSLAIVIVLVTEIMNTAVEAVVDMVSGNNFHPVAKIAKDTAAGAVFVASFGALVLGFLILYPHVQLAVTSGAEKVKAARESIAFMALVVVIIAVIVAKAYLNRGKPLEGGMPSGHAAVSFAVLVAVFFLTTNALAVILVLVMAIMVAHSRVALKIHSVREVVLGALLGGLITLVIFLLFL